MKVINNRVTAESQRQQCCPGYKWCHGKHSVGETLLCLLSVYHTMGSWQTQSSLRMGSVPEEAH